MFVCTSHGQKTLTKKNCWCHDTALFSPPPARKCQGDDGKVRGGGGKNFRGDREKTCWAQKKPRRILRSFPWPCGFPLARKSESEAKAAQKGMRRVNFCPFVSSGSLPPRRASVHSEKLHFPRPWEKTKSIYLLLRTTNVITFVAWENLCCGAWE